MKNIRRGEGNDGAELLICVNPKTGKHHIRWDVQPNTGEDADGSPNTGVNFMVCEHTPKPTLDEIKELILTWHNDQISDRIKSGFVYKDMSVWLSVENQINYRALRDLALRKKDTKLPTFKFEKDGKPFLHTFKTVAELTAFVDGFDAYIQQVQADGWKAKAIDWSIYE